MRQNIGKNGLAEAVKAKSNTDRRYHPSGDTGGEAKPGVRSQNPGEHVFLGRSEECITQWFSAEIESLSDSDHCQCGCKKPCLGFRDTNIARFIDAELSHIVIDHYS